MAQVLPCITFLLLQMLLHRHTLSVDPEILVDSLPLQEIIVSQYRSPLDSGFQALIKKFIDQGTVNPVFMDICTSVLQSGKISRLETKS